MLELHKRLGPAVRHYRGEAGLSQAVLARKVGKSQPWIAAVESGHLDVQLGQVERLAASLNVKPETLLEFDPAAPPDAQA